MPTVKYVGSLDVIFHSAPDVRVTLESVSFIPGLKVNLLSLHTCLLYTSDAADE